MRCYGLTTDRHRCSTDAQDATNFCAEHRAMEQIEQSTEPALETRGGVARFLQLLKPASAKKAVPDDANFAVPGWLKKRSTPHVIDRLLNDPS